MSLRWRIMGTMVLLIVLTVLINVGVGYYATQSRLGVFVDEIGVDEADRLARRSEPGVHRDRWLGNGGQTAVRGRIHLRRSSAEEAARRRRGRVLGPLSR